MDMYKQIAQIISIDPGKRGLAGNVPLPDMQAMCQSLSAAARVIIVTGFTVTPQMQGETDGPSGAVAIASALLALGKQVTIATDSISLPLLKAAATVCASDAQIVCVPSENSAEFCKKLLSDLAPSHVIAIERPGKGRDGTFYNLRGDSIDHCAVDTDGLFDTQAVTIAIGDGGNELGMGALPDSVLDKIPFGHRICSRSAAQYLFAAGVSNWGGWAIQAALSHFCGKNLMNTRQQESEILHAVVDAGGIDGIIRKHGYYVDGLTEDENLEIHAKLRELIGV